MSSTRRRSVMTPTACDTCGSTFKRKGSLYEHLRAVHQITDLNLEMKGKLACPIADCEVKSCSRYKVLRKHIEDQHNVVIETENLVFPTERDFMTWKQQMEKSETCSYVRPRGYKRLANGDQKAFFTCNRSGTFVPSSSGQRRMKRQGTNKIGAVCPAGMDVLVKASLVTYVAYYKTHCGHTRSTAHINLHHDDRIKIAALLKAGGTMKRVMTEVRESVSEGGEAYQSRLNAITHQDLKNIKRDFLRVPVDLLKLNKCAHSDSANVQTWIETMIALGADSPVLYHKIPGCKDPHNLLDDQDFMLVIMTRLQYDMFLTLQHNGNICLDLMRGTSEYNFDLYALLTVDDDNLPCPLAFCLSNRFDATAYTALYSRVRDKVGAIGTKVFMTHDVPAMYNAWCDVMGTPERHFLCTWHVDKHWRAQLNKIGGSKETRPVVYKILCRLLQEPSVREMTELQANFVKELNEDEETSEFGAYFDEYYASRPEEWAHCYRVAAGLDTDAHLDSMHKLLRHIYIEGKKEKRPDKCINALIKMSHDKIFSHVRYVTKKPPIGQMRLIDQSHDNSRKIPVSAISSVREGVWDVKSNELVYRVTKADGVTCDNCFLRCMECDICVHSYSCECIDSLIRYNICEHVHACRSGHAAGDTDRAEVLRLVDASSPAPERCPPPAAAPCPTVAQPEVIGDEQKRLVEKLDLCKEYLNGKVVSRENLEKLSKLTNQILSTLQIEAKFWPRTTRSGRLFDSRVQ